MVPKRRLLPGGGRSRRDAVSVQVITYAPTVFTHCQHCEVAFGEVGLGERIRRDEAASALPPDLALDFAKLSDWVRAIVERHGAGIHVEVIDAASVEGMLASIRHRVWRYPTVVVDGDAMQIGGDYAVADPAIDRAIHRRGVQPPERATARASNERMPSA